RQWLRARLAQNNLASDPGGVFIPRSFSDSAALGIRANIGAQHIAIALLRLDILDDEQVLVCTRVFDDKIRRFIRASNSEKLIQLLARDVGHKTDPIDTRVTGVNGHTFDVGLPLRAFY